MGIGNLRSCFALILAFMVLPAFAQGEVSQADSAVVAGKRHMVYISGGASVITSKVFDEYSAANNKVGYEWMAGYDWILSKSGLGIGLLYNGFYTNKNLALAMGGGTGRAPGESTFMLNTFAPQFVVDVLRPGGRWAFSFKAGMGLSTLTESLKLRDETIIRHTRYGFAVTMMGDVEYRLNRHIGITGTLAYISSFFGTLQEYPDGKVYADGVQRISLNLGVKYRF